MASVEAALAFHNSPSPSLRNPVPDAMPPTARVRPARVDDLAHIVPLFCSSLDLTPHSKGSDGTLPYDLSLINNIVLSQCFPSDQESVQTYVVEDFSADQIQGFAIVKALEPEKSHELNQLVVPAMYRSKRTMNMLMSYLQNQHCEYGLWVRVIKRCEKACRFYKKWNFNFVREMQADGVNETVVIMYWPGTSARP